MCTKSRKPLKPLNLDQPFIYGLDYCIRYVQFIIQYDSNCISRDHEGLHIFTPRNQPKRKLKLPSKTQWLYWLGTY